MKKKDIGLRGGMHDAIHRQRRIWGGRQHSHI